MVIQKDTNMGHKIGMLYVTEMHHILEKHDKHICIYMCEYIHIMYTDIHTQACA